VTRALLLELADRVGIPAEERDVTIDALARGDEAFLSSTTREVQPIASVDGVPMHEVCGPISRRLAEAFTDLVARDLDP
jgi:branched-subunit amino acid aminotransferase/4-amino-4-deoxychorismate lyase